jgi:hypothetical protein
MRATLMLADHAMAVGGRLFINGGGWNAANAAAPLNCAVAILLQLPHDEHKKHKLVLELLDADGQPIRVSREDGVDAPVKLAGEVERNAGQALPVEGASESVSFAFNVHGVRLAAGRYEWRFWINGDTREEWRLPFAMAAAAAG